MKAKQKPLSDHLYGRNHPYIGKPCLYRGIPAIPYGSYFLEKNEHVVNLDVRLVLLMFEENGIGGCSGLHSMSGVEPDDKDLLVLDSESVSGKRVLHTVLIAADDFLQQGKRFVTHL